MRFNPREEPIASIYEDSLDAFGTELINFFNGRKTPVFLLKQQGDLDEVLKTKGNVKPPFFTYRPGDVALFEEYVNNERLQRHGIVAGGPRANLDDLGRPVDPNRNYDRLNAVQVEVNITVEYICTYAEQINFSQIWIPLSVRPVRFQMVYGDFETHCLMMFDKSITYSDADFDQENLTTCQTNCVLRTWMASEGKTRPVSRYTVEGKVLGSRAGNSEGRRGFAGFTISIDEEGTEVEP